MPDWRNQRPASSKNVFNLRLYNEAIHALPSPASDRRSIDAQAPIPVGIVRGDIVSRSSNEIAVRTNGATAACFYDAHTYFGRDRAPMPASGLFIGDPVEVLADRQPGSTACYARTVQVIDVRARRVKIEAPVEAFTPRGDLLFAGVVPRRGATTLTLETREGEKTLLLRPDARYWSDGLRTAGNTLAVNTRVFVHAGRDFEGNVEIYEAARGAIVPAPEFISELLKTSPVAPLLSSSPAPPPESCRRRRSFR